MGIWGWGKGYESMIMEREMGAGEEKMSMGVERMRKGDMGREEHQGGHATLLIICIHL